MAAYWLMGLSSPTAFAISIDTIMQYVFMEMDYSSNILWSTEFSKIPIAGRGCDEILTALTSLHHIRCDDNAVCGYSSVRTSGRLA